MYISAHVRIPPVFFHVDSDDGFHVNTSIFSGRFLSFFVIIIHPALRHAHCMEM